MDWFEKLTGFREGSYAETRRKLVVEDTRLTSLVNGRSYAAGAFELASLAALRARAGSGTVSAAPLSVSIVKADVRRLHSAPEYAGALFQVASQFNALEMADPVFTPEDGVTRYAYVHTQGPACAVAAGAATIYRNYFVPLGDRAGQTAARQLDGGAAVRAALARRIGVEPAALWTMKNGYAFFEESGLAATARCLESLPPDAIDDLRQALAIGLHADVEVTDAPETPGPLVSQAFCSALPIAYNDGLEEGPWRPLATLILEAACEATIAAAALNARRGASPIVLLTLVGGGVFGNPIEWILAAIERALQAPAAAGLDVRIVSYGRPPAELESFVARQNHRAGA